MFIHIAYLIVLPAFGFLFAAAITMIRDGSERKNDRG
jgi:hypothetical protein